jgi:integrase
MNFVHQHSNKAPAATKQPRPPPESTTITPDYVEVIGEGDARILVRNGLFALCFNLGTGRVKQTSLKTSQLHVARQRAQLLYARYQFRTQAGLQLDARTVQDVAEEYMVARDPAQVGYEVTRSEGGTSPASESTWRMLYRTTRFIIEFAGKTRVEHVNDQVLDDYVSWRRTYYQRADPATRAAHTPNVMSQRSLARELSTFKTLLRFAGRRGYLGERYQIPTTAVKTYTRIARPPFTDRDCARLRRLLDEWTRAARGTRNEHTSLVLRDFVLVLLFSGLRVGEANSLTWERIEPFTDSRGRKNLRLHVRGKTGKRSVIPRRSIVRVFKRLRARAEAQGNAGPRDPVFVMRDGTPATDMATPFRRLLERYGLDKNVEGERYCLYCLRHTYALRALRRRVDLFMLARNMGTSVQMIQQYYGSRVTAELGREQLGD